ncbi:MAG TPA: hypothetical protein VN618_04745 [Solirubrobacteraceae bacterium]|nr:hypothetical protein [Solirubrobacteraceae bacterium]
MGIVVFFGLLMGLPVAAGHWVREHLGTRGRVAALVAVQQSRETVGGACRL